MRVAWLMLVPLSLAGCGIVVGLGDPLPVRGDDAGDSAVDTAVDTPDLPANVLLLDAAGRFALASVGSAGWRMKSDAIEPGFIEAAKVGGSTVLLLDPIGHKKRSLTFDKVAWTAVLTDVELVGEKFDHLTAVGPDLVAWIASATGAYRVERLVGKTWTLAGEGTSPDFKDLTLFAYSDAKMLRFWNKSGKAWGGWWADGSFNGLPSVGGTYGWNQLTAVGGPTFFIYSSILSPARGTGGLEQIKIGPSGEVLAPTAATFRAEEFPWADWDWTTVARAGGNVVFYKKETGDTRLLRFIADTSLAFHTEEVATDAKPGVGWTKIVGLD
ncbi:MAG: hypothetical protein IPJ34_16320 [Myxococcales bacterium]|nr:hypothetical protein [Myxococcales bacterium]